MTRPLLDFAELRALLDALCEETITAEQLRRLEELVLAHPEAEAYYVQAMSLHADLVHHFGAGTGARETGRQGGEETGRRGEQQAVRGRRFFPISLSPRLLVAGAALAAAGLLLAVGLWHRSPVESVPSGPGPEAVDDSVAVLLQAPEAEWEGADPPLRPGAPLAPGWLRLKAGYAHLEFYGGATVILEGPAEFNLISRSEGYCARGKLRATVPPQAQGFTIGSPTLELVDRGTEFGLQVGAGDRTEVHVFQGRVDLYDPGPERPAAARQELTTGQGVRLDGPGQASAIAASPAAFKTAEDLAAKLLKEMHRRQQDWLAAGDALRRDPSLVVYYPFQPEHEWSRTLPDRATDRQHPHDGAVVGCAWVPGRWPGKQGLEFKRVSDRVRFHVPGDFDALTLLAWVRVDALPNRFNSLMMTDGWDDAAPHWHISDGGKVELGIQGPNKKGGVHYVSGEVLTAEQLGQWVQLAVVYDRNARQVTHYVNGQPVKQEPLKLDVALRLGNVELGNWNLGSRPHNHPVRYFSGCMDEFLLFSRALGDDEIERLYLQGRPPA